MSEKNKDMKAGPEESRPGWLKKFLGWLARGVEETRKTRASCRI